MGELRNNLDNTGAWIRVYGGENEVSGNSSSNMKYKATQGGYDWTQRLKSGKLVTGLAVSYLKGDADLAGGSGDITSTMFGVYGSYIGDKGHFADVIAKYGRSKSEFSSVSELNSYDADYASTFFVSQTTNMTVGFRLIIPATASVSVPNMAIAVSLSIIILLNRRPS